MSGLLAHGGVGGAIVKVALTLTIELVFFAVWRRERTTKTGEAP